MVADSATTPSKSKDALLSPSSTPTTPKPPPPRPEDEIRAAARKLSDQPVQNSEPGVWAVLTAISKNARQRPQGMHILLSADEHCLGRCVEDPRFQIVGPPISANHCKISRERVEPGAEQNSSTCESVFIKDTSTNGTYLNWTRLRKSSAKAKLQHGDIVSFTHPPHEGNAYAFVFREVSRSIGSVNGASLKRKSEDLGVESKRLKGIGIGAPEGPISLDDVRSLQRSNTELRHQLESHVLTIETMRSENRAAIVHHENELKHMKETASSSYLDQINELQCALDSKQKELDELNVKSAELRHSIKDLNERLSASMQSRVDADEIIHSQKTAISELETQLDEERNQRREEREKSQADLKSALQRAHSEAQEEIKRQADIYLKQHREQQEVISKLQESEKESRLLVEALRSKLEDARENLVISEKKVRQLEVQVQDEQQAFANSRKKVESLESELRRMRKEFESEKVAREEAWNKVSALELELAAAIRDLSIEKQRFQGARERIILRETQLRSFYSTTEEISALFLRQQEQLKSMQKTLEDEENYENTSLGIDLNEPVTATSNAACLRVRDENHNARENSGASTPKNAHADNSSSHGDGSGDASTTEKHDCDARNQDGNTQDIECTSSNRLLKGFGPDIEFVGTAVVPDGNPTDTECVLGTESPTGDVRFDETNAALHKCSNLAGETMQIDDEVQILENLEPTARMPDNGAGCSSPSRLEDTEIGMIRTGDLLTSEVPGSWAMSTAPSFNGENESPRTPRDPDDGGQAVAAATALLLCSDGQEASGSQSNAHSVTELTKEHRALNAMIEIVAPDFRQQYQGCDGRVGEQNESMSDAETEEGSNHSDSGDGGYASGEAVGNTLEDDCNEVMIEDSVG